MMTVPLASHPGLIHFGRRGWANQLHTAVAAWAVALGLFVGAGNSRAATLIWTNGSDSWQSTTAWSPAGGFPGEGDGAVFTNPPVGVLVPATYTVTLNADVSVNNVLFNNGTTTTATISLDLGTNSLSAYKSGSGQPTALNISDHTRATATVYIASATGVGGFFVTNAAGDTRMTIGRNGVATLIITNGLVVANSVVFGNGSGGRGTLVLSGANTYWTNSSSFAIGNAGGSCVNNLVISNSASLTVVGLFKVGFNSTSSTNSLLLDTGGRLFTRTNGTAIGTSGSNNVATVQGGAVWDNGGNDFNIGGSGSSNSLTIGTGSAVINISAASVSAANTLDLQGGLLQASVVVSNFGTLQGFGTIIGDTIVTNALSPANSLGPLVFSNHLIMASTAGTTVQLGTNFNPTAVSSNLTLDGTLDITDSGGFTNGTYTLFTYDGTLTTNGTAEILTIGTTPNASFAYTIDISTAGSVKLNALEPGNISVTPATYDFGTLVTGTTAQASFVITNSGGVAVSNGTATVTGAPFSILSGASFSVPGFGTTNVTVEFGPVSAGNFTDSVVFATANGGETTNTVTGAGILALIVNFSGSPTTGAAPLTVTFTDSSIGNITNRVWDFGDGSTSNTTATSVDYTYNVTGTHGVSLSVFGPSGSSTTNRLNYIIVTNTAPQITSGPTVTNALLQVGSTMVVVANTTNTFAVTATDANGDPLDYQWDFGDGDSTNTSLGAVEHAYTNDCGPYNASATVGDGQGSTSNDLTVVVACELRITKLQVKPNFKKPDADRFSLQAAIDLPDGFSVTNKSVTVDVGGAQASFTLDAKGRGANALGTFKLSFNKKTSDWTVKVKQNRGSWQIPWDAVGLVNTDVPKPGNPVTITVVVLVGNEGFAVDDALTYTAKADKSGVAQ